MLDVYPELRTRAVPVLRPNDVHVAAIELAPPQQPESNARGIQPHDGRVDRLREHVVGQQRGQVDAIGSGHATAPLEDGEPLPVADISAAIRWELFHVQLPRQRRIHSRAPNRCRVGDIACRDGKGERAQLARWMRPAHAADHLEAVSRKSRRHSRRRARRARGAAGRQRTAAPRTRGESGKQATCGHSHGTVHGHDESQRRSDNLACDWKPLPSTRVTRPTKRLAP